MVKNNYTVWHHKLKSQIFHKSLNEQHPKILSSNLTLTGQMLRVKKAGKKADFKLDSIFY